MAALRHAASRLTGSALLQRPHRIYAAAVSPAVQEELIHGGRTAYSRRCTSFSSAATPNSDASGHLCTKAASAGPQEEWAKEVAKKTEELYNLLDEGERKEYMVGANQRRRMLMCPLSKQIEPRPDDPLWCMISMRWCGIKDDLK